MEPKKLYKSTTNKVMSGVIGGIGEYLNVDPVPLRLIWLIVVLITGIFPGIIAYIIAIFIVPDRPVVSSTNTSENISSADTK